jgi:hypothetical protein
MTLTTSSIFPHQLFVNLLTDQSLNDLVVASEAAAALNDGNAEVYQDLTIHLKEAVLVRDALKKAGVSVKLS